MGWDALIGSWLPRRGLDQVFLEALACLVYIQMNVKLAARWGPKEGVIRCEEHRYWRSNSSPLLCTFPFFP
jgi:hypothetical protein